MREPLQDIHDDNYERPNQDWICGLTKTGEACPIGPGPRGKCLGASACHPIREGDRWRCNRSDSRGGPCEDGPSPEGVCCLHYSCSPMKSLRALRGRFVRICFLVALGCVCLMLSADWRNEFIAPGQLSVHHAQLLHRDDATNRCASCHASGTQTFLQWLNLAVDEDFPSPTQTARCLECHGEMMSSELATIAHNIDLNELIKPEENSSRRRDPHEPLACAVCHQEHHGKDHNLSWMSDQSCQACHKERYHSFASNHPDFGSWPITRRTRIAFDHASHEIKHFPDEKKDYSCKVCHKLDTGGAFQQTLSYQKACADCHDRKLKMSWEKGIALFSLPMLDVEALKNAGHPIGEWPEDAEGDFDGALSPIAKFLLLSDKQASHALKTLGSDFDYYDVDADDAEQLKAAAEVTLANKRLMHDVVTGGHAIIQRRIEEVLGREISTKELADLTSRISPDNLSAIQDIWLPNLYAEMNSGARKTTAITKDNTFLNLEEASELVASGGWLSDELDFSIRYLPTGHDDPWLMTWLSLLAEAASGKHAELVEPLLSQMMAPTAAGQCGSCHSIERTEKNTFQIQWLSKQPTDKNIPLTKFSHAPHTLQKQLADCTGCHRVNPQAKVMENYLGYSSQEYVSGFEPITKASCSECHVSGAAGDSCLQCHQYHSGMSEK